MPFKPKEEKAEEEANEWFKANYPEEQTSEAPHVSQQREVSWYAPPHDRLKRNIGASCSASNSRSDASWVVRDSRGKVLMHSRRSYYAVTNRERAELLETLWAVECMRTMRKDNIIFESCFLLARTSLLESGQSSEVGGVVSQIMGSFQVLTLGPWSMCIRAETR
ncbi:hypothetical protein F2Q68_00035915 [Brassica cretica]|uniref:RNase H type-1 domain-containing protein n=1 Tax=Brassica cretica TaxID=69181 RepID=A0A8S9GUV9_BRACR|nr:hypothetical protein F2Q68_00035915 [Brassica cretica]